MNYRHCTVGTPRKNYSALTRLMTASAMGVALFAAGCGGGDSGPPVAGGGGGVAPPTQPDPGPAVVNTQDMRVATLLDKQAWKFVQDDGLTDEVALAGDGAGWTSVKLPHSWNEGDAASIVQTTPTSVSYKRGRGWYRLEFDNPSAGATQWLQFDGASIVADVWLNGEKLGQHKGAFTAFRFDVTSKLKSGKNVLLVKADNSKANAAGDLTAIIPLGGDFNMSGGLYRSVSLVSTPGSAHIALDDLGSSGVFARTRFITAGGAATVNVRAKLKNSTPADGSFTVQATLSDAAGKIAKTSSRAVEIKAGQAADLAQDLVLDNAHLWNGLEDPYLYKLVVELKDSTGGAVDRVVQDFGIRQAKIDPQKGFFLNGKSVPLRGVNMHQDYQDKAWAISNADTDESLDLIKEIGANTLRLAHYPHGQYTLQQTDKRGLVVWAELPYVNASAVSCDAAMNPDLVDNAKLQLQELIRQQYNHASIATWSIGNEVTQGSGCNSGNNPMKLLSQLEAVAKAEDASRPTTLAANKHYTEVSGITDIWAMNQYFMWYNSSQASGLGALLDLWHEYRSNQAIGVSEYGAGAAISHQSDNLTDSVGVVASGDGTGKRRVVYQPEGYAGLVHEQNYEVMAARPYIWGTYVWNMFDFGSETRHEGDIGGTNTKGLVTFDRKTKKDPFFYYKATWSKEPVTHITGKRYVDRNYATTDVKVYSNADTVTLKVNGTAIKTLTAAECPNKTCQFTNVQLAAGDNNVVAEGSHNGKAVADGTVWKLDADHANGLYLAAGQITTGFVSEAGSPLGVAKRFGSDTFFTGGVRKNMPATQTMNNLGTATLPADGRVWDAYREEVTGGSGGTRGTGFTYSANLVPGRTYTVTLGFMEPSSGVGQRQFDVRTVTGGVTTTVLTKLDVRQKVGATYAAYAERFNVTAGPDGSLKLEFQGQTGKAMVSNIMIAPV